MQGSRYRRLCLCGSGQFERSAAVLSPDHSRPQGRGRVWCCLTTGVRAGQQGRGCLDNLRDGVSLPVSPLPPRSTELYHTVLYFTILCCFVLCCVMLFCAVLCNAVLCCAVQRCAVLCCAVPCRAVLYHTMLYRAVPCRAMLYCAVICCAVLFYTVLCCTVLCGAIPGRVALAICLCSGRTVTGRPSGGGDGGGTPEQGPRDWATARRRRRRPVPCRAAVVVC